MTAIRKSREDPNDLKGTQMPSITTPKNITKIGCWNVRTMFQIGKTAYIVRELNRYKLDIMGLSEVRWTGFGELKTTSGETIFPTNEAEEADKDTFYQQLQREISKVPKHDILMVMGDANAKVGKLNEGWERVIGQEGIRTMNENSTRLAEMCALNNLIIRGTLFKHLDIHKFTWESPTGRDRNQIGHVMVNGRYKKSVCDVRVMLGANSDHHLVLAKVKMKL
ncbi:craniofacial development protein 2-like [Saccostrea cucullata]|uniref:craniofacial development protein 2-like n=1 Tax=Saccostrea cuccullata TaxID=36930 RepID=UPI002ED223C1